MSKLNTLQKPKKRIRKPKVEYPKYRIATLLRHMYGEFNYEKLGISDLATFCKLQKKQTVKEWLNIRAGSTKRVNHLIIGNLLLFFSLQFEDQLFTTEHKQMLNTNSVAA